MPRAVPLHPKNPERVCWGCDKYCLADDLACGNGTIRALHPIELFGDDWLEWCSPALAPPRIFPRAVGDYARAGEIAPEPFAKPPAAAVVQAATGGPAIAPFSVEVLMKPVTLPVCCCCKQDPCCCKDGCCCGNKNNK